MVAKKKQECKKKMKKCCNKKELDAMGNKKVKRCCCVPGGMNGNRGGRGSESPRGDPWSTPYEDPRGSPRGSPRGDTSGTRGEGVSIRDIGAAMMGGISTTVGSSVTPLR